MPPFGIGLDRLWNGSEVGSKAVYNFFKKNQPRLALYGHIHGSPKVTGQWLAKIGQTVCIQPGQFDELVYVMIDLSKMRFKRIKERRK